MKDKLSIALGARMAQSKVKTSAPVQHSEITRPFSLKDPKAIVDEIAKLKAKVDEPVIDWTEAEKREPEEPMKRVDLADIFKSLREKE